jgi:hypothetical protein
LGLSLVAPVGHNDVVACRIALLIAGTTGCLIAEPPDGEWRPLTSECVSFGDQPSPILHDEPKLREFIPAGDTIVFDDVDGLSQISLRDRERSLIARINSDGAAQFHRMENDLVYFARGEFDSRDLVVDRGAEENPRWLTVAYLSMDDFTQVISDRAGFYWRSEVEDRWKRWDRSTAAIVPSRLPDDAEVTSDGERLFYKVPATSRDGFEYLYTLPIDGGTPTLIAEAIDVPLPVGIGDSRLFTWSRETTWLVEATPGGDRYITSIPEIGIRPLRAFGGGYFYWALTIDPRNVIVRVPLDGGVVEFVTTIQSGKIGLIKADACNVYWQVQREEVADLYAQRH